MAPGNGVVLAYAGVLSVYDRELSQLSGKIFAGIFAQTFPYCPVWFDFIVFFVRNRLFSGKKGLD